MPAKTAPFLPIKDEQCCHGMVSIGVDLLDAYQDIPFGTPAWKRSYGRNPVEKTISMIKDQRRPESRMVPGFRSSCSHHRRVGPSHPTYSADSTLINLPASGKSYLAGKMGLLYDAPYDFDQHHIGSHCGGCPTGGRGVAGQRVAVR